MEGDAGSGRLNPTPPGSTGDDAELSEAEEPVNQAPAGDAERSEAEEAVNPAEATSDDAGPGDAEAAVTSPRSRLGSGRWLVAVCSVLVLVSISVAVGGFLALRSHQQSAAAGRAETAALAAAKDCVTATQAPDATSMAASQQKIIDCATGDFGAQAALYSSLLVDAYQAANVQVQVSDMRAAVERHNGDGSMDVLVAMRVKVSNAQSKDQEQGYRLRVRMMSDAGTFKIAKLDQVSK